LDDQFLILRSSWLWLVLLFLFSRKFDLDFLWNVVFCFGVDSHLSDFVDVSALWDGKAVSYQVGVSYNELNMGLIVGIKLDVGRSSLWSRPER